MTFLDSVYCSSCGEEVGDAQSASFCPNCGATLDQQETDSAESSTATNQMVREPESSEVTTSAAQSKGSSSLIEDLPLLKGAVSGAAAYIGGYLLFILLVLGLENDDLTRAISSGGDDLAFVGLIYHNAQFVDVAAPNQNFNYFDSDFSTLFDLPTVLYRIIPIVLLVVVGYLLVSSLEVTDTTAGVKFGATIAVGVSVVAAIGASVFSISGGGESASPQLLTSILIIGAVYPVLFGGIGGYIAGSRTG